MDTKTSLAVTAGGGVVSVPFAYITHRVLTRWGVLDGFADDLGDYLKRNVEPSDVGWALAGILTLCVYGALLWFVWHKKKLQPEPAALPVAPVPPLPERFEAGSGDAPAALVHPLPERANTSNETTIHPDELRKLRAIEQSYEVERARKIQKALENMKIPLPDVTDHSSIPYANWDMVKFQIDKNLISFGVPREEIAAANEAATARIKSDALFCTLGPDDAAHFSSPAAKQRWHIQHACVDARMTLLQQKFPGTSLVA